MLNKENIIKRLALIKYLYKMGIEQSKQSEPMSSFSILSLHDSIEMFLMLLAEHLDIDSNNFRFIQYWDNIPTLTHREPMRNLNERRRSVKHKGLFLSKSDIEICRVNARNFFEENTLTQFEVDFKDISLFSLIQYTNIRQDLEKAQNALNNNEFENCIKTIAVAFAELISSYENSKSDYFGDSPFFFGKDLRFLSSYDMKSEMNRRGRGIGINNDIEWADIVGRKLGEFVDNVKDSLEEIQSAVKIISFGIDYKKFVKFKLLTPVVTKTFGGYVAEIMGKKKWTTENCQYCIDFVLESSLKLQEFDFDINELIEKEKLTIHTIN